MTKSNQKLSAKTRVAQALRYINPETGAIIPPIQSSATFARDENYETRKPYWYKRDGNETTSHAEAMIADLEEAKDTLLFSSGMSAATAVIDHLEEKCYPPKVSIDSNYISSCYRLYISSIDSNGKM